MRYENIQDFAKIADKNKKMYIFDFDGTLCCGKYADKGINGMALTPEKLFERDSVNSPYLNGTVRLSRIGQWLVDSDINQFIVITSSMNCDATLQAKHGWLEKYYSDKNYLYISVSNHMDKFNDLIEVLKIFPDSIYVDDSLEALLDLERRELDCELVHISTFEVDYMG